MSNTNILHRITIAEYRNHLQSDKPSDWENIQHSIAELLDDKSYNALFEAQKELLMLRHRLTISLLEQGIEDKKLLWLIGKAEKRIEIIISKISNQNNTETAAFEGWLISVSKFLGYSIPNTESIYYLCIATKQMQEHYEAEIRSVERKKSKYTK